MKLIIVDEQEKTERGVFAITEDEMQKVVELLASFGCDLEAAQPSVQRTACPVPHPQQDFEFICDLCGEHVPARRR